ncbi:hypothetical protein SAMD00019534_005750 [Acytostelium subglobosum LB1]|uniref:hypothetical protein n=1 Tax=Acytostelium subglobosum LB1 TaxID=1410327 RepID=UPI000644EE87|nr:hypothetical protein SAMD00019534_005750 [Acytostelium subglobosum LB1]GAM17400.1 hypothetical protein SAMD00019534_005750 [Acytostelium subglobosum LB1]|eukprot:XP_012759462.1 hypothetical protein SAMD00019534_005750 [Acytostelium subglobosum LB1]
MLPSIIGNNIKSLILRVLVSGGTQQDLYDKNEIGRPWMQALTDCLPTHFPNIKSLTIYDQCMAYHSGYGLYIMENPDQFYGTLSKLSRLESLSINVSPSCCHNFDDGSESNVPELLRYIQRSPELKSLALFNPLPSAAQVLEVPILLDYMFTDVTCSLQHITLDLSNFIDMPMLQRRLDTLCISGGAISIRSMGQIEQLKQHVNDILDLSRMHIDTRGMDPDMIKTILSPATFVGRVYKPPKYIGNTESRQYKHKQSIDHPFNNDVLSVGTPTSIEISLIQLFPTAGTYNT